MTEPTIEEVREWAERQKQHYSGSYGGHGYAAVNAINALLNFLTPKPRTAEEVIAAFCREVWTSGTSMVIDDISGQLAQTLRNEGLLNEPERKPSLPYYPLQCADDVWGRHEVVPTAFKCPPPCSQQHNRCKRCGIQEHPCEWANGISGAKL